MKLHARPPIDMTRDASNGAVSHLLRFQSLFNEGRSLCFPCDAAGQVALQSLGEHARNNYFFARASIGRNFAHPRVEPALH